MNTSKIDTSLDILLINEDLDNKIREIYNFRDIINANLKKSLEDKRNDSISAFRNVIDINRKTQSKIAPALMDISDKVVTNTCNQIRSYDDADRRAN